MFYFYAATWRSHTGESPGKEKQNTWSLSRCLNTVNDEAEVSCSGSVFHMQAPATGKAREPTEVSRTAGDTFCASSRSVSTLFLVPSRLGNAKPVGSQYPWGRQLKVAIRIHNTRCNYQEHVQARVRSALTASVLAVLWRNAGPYMGIAFGPTQRPVPSRQRQSPNG